MALIKHTASDRLMASAIVLDLGDLDRQGQAIIARARAQAKQILDDARREAQRLIDGAAEIGRSSGVEQGLVEGRERGRAEGRADLLAELRPRLGELLGAWAAALEQWERERAEMLLAAREDVLAFALTATRKITTRMVHTDPSVVQDQLAEALSMLASPSALTIVINPADRPLVEEVLPELVAQIQSCAHVSLRDEAAVSRGGCIVGTAGGEIDASIETQLDRIAEALIPAQDAMD
jgi:flagellar assembly protein FliH